MKKRAEKLKLSTKINGIDYLLVTVHNRLNFAMLELYFFNGIKISGRSRIAKDGDNSSNYHDIFPITSGQIIRARKAPGQVKVTSISRPDRTKNVLLLKVEPIGDYSNYVLGIGEDYKEDFDPLFSEIEFLFRPGCFNVKCRREDIYKPSEKYESIIDYLAKDFHTFKNTMISAMAERVPGWEPSSEADLDMVLIELISAAADELSDFQDRVMNEAYLGTTRKRVSLERHARLMDYYIFQGNQANTWLTIETNNIVDLPTNSEFQTERDNVSQPMYFSTKTSQKLYPIANRLIPYTWEGVISYLKAGTTEVELKIMEPDGNVDNFKTSNSKHSYKKLKDLIMKGEITQFLLQESINPKAAQYKDVKSRRQLLHLKISETTVKRDPMTGDWYIQVQWIDSEKLMFDYPIDQNTIAPLFYGNLTKVFHGEFMESHFLDPKSDLRGSNQYHYENTKWGVICELPDSPLSYLDPFPDGYPQNFKGQRPSYSTLDVFVIKGISPSRWIEVSSFVDYDENDDCYVVETDEYGASLIRFGNGINGKKLPNDAEVQCRYQIGLGQSGNVGADQIRIISQGYSWGSKIRRFWNPFNVVNGREPESLEEIRRNIPEAFTHKQYRAVTVNNLIDDYELRAEELSEVSKALATYRWMGSWRIVQLHIDPSESVEVTPELERNILLHIDSVKLIGDHVVINSAKYTPLEIKVSVCIHPNYWIEDIRYQIEAEFTSGYTPDGRKGFFNPDSWTFGQMVEKSQIIGRIQAIEGVDHVIDGNPNSIIIKKWLESSSTPNEIIIQPNEIIQVMNNPNQIEKGFMFLDFKGGRH